MSEHQQSFLVRMAAGQPKFMVAPLRGYHPPRAWRFFHGACAIDKSLTDAIERALLTFAKANYR
jgi:hypothetical protein